MAKNKIALIALVGLIVALIPGRWVMGYRSGILDDKAEIESTNEQYETRLSTAEAAAVDLTANTAIVDQISAGLPPKLNFDRLLIDLSGLADRTGVDLLAASPSQDTGTGTGPAKAGATPGVNEFNVNTTISGTLGQVTAFIRGLRDLPRVALVESVTLAFSDGHVSTQLPLKVFTWIPPVVAAPTG